MPPLLPVPHIQQTDHGECLAVCVAMVLQYLNISFSYRKLRTLLKIRPRLGTPFFNIERLERIGIKVTYQQGNLDTLQAHLQQGKPPIVPVDTSELPYWRYATYHAVVVVGIDDEMVYVNDPEFANAPIQLSRGDFDLAWLNRDEWYALLF